MAAPATVSGKFSPLKATDWPLQIQNRIAQGSFGKAGESVRAASQETCRLMSPIVRAGRAEERTTVVATDAIGVGSRISYVSE